MSSIKEKLPLINSKSSRVRVLGYIAYALAVLFVVGLISPHNDGSVNTMNTVASVPATSSSTNVYSTSEDTVALRSTTELDQYSNYLSEGDQIQAENYRKRLVSNGDLIPLSAGTQVEVTHTMGLWAAVKVPGYNGTYYMVQTSLNI